MKIELCINDYCLEVIERTVSYYTGDYYGSLQHLGDNKILVSIEHKNTDSKNVSGKLPDIERDFLNKLINNSIRYKIALKTSTLRKLIIGRALYQSCINIAE